MFSPCNKTRSSFKLTVVLAWVLASAIPAVSHAGEDGPTTPPKKGWFRKVRTAFGTFWRSSVPNRITDQEEANLPHAEPSDYHRINPIALFVVHPRAFSHAASRSGVSVAYNTTNVWNPTIYVMPRSKLIDTDAPVTPDGPFVPTSEVIFVNPEGETPVEDLNDLGDLKFSNMSPEDFKKYATVLHADGVMENIDLRFEQPLPKASALYAQLELYKLVGGAGLTDPSDGFIERFHSKILGDHQPFGRDAHAYDQAQIYFRDASGKSIRFNENDVSAAFRLDYVKSIDLISPDRKVLTSINLVGTTGTTLTEKARALAPAIQLGFGINPVTTARVSPRSTATFGLGYFGTAPRAIPLGAGVDLKSRAYQGQISTLIAFSNTNAKNTRVMTYGLSYQRSDVAIRDEYRTKAPIVDATGKIPLPFKGTSPSRNAYDTHNANLQGFVGIELKRLNAAGRVWAGEDMVPVTNAGDINFGGSLIKRF